MTTTYAPTLAHVIAGRDGASITGQLRDGASPVDRSAEARRTLAAVFPGTSFKVRTHSSKYTVISWTDGPSAPRVQSALYGIFTDVERVTHARGSAELAHEVTPAAIATAIVLHLFDGGKLRRGRDPRRGWRDSEELLASRVMRRHIRSIHLQLVRRDHAASALHIDRAAFDQAHRLADLLVVVAQAERQTDPDQARDTCIEWILDNGLDGLETLDQLHHA